MADQTRFGQMIASTIHECAPDHSTHIIAVGELRDAARTMGELFDGLERAFIFICHNMPLGPTNDRTEAGKLIDSLRLPLAKAREEDGQ